MKYKYLKFIKILFKRRWKPLILLFQLKTKLEGKRFYCSLLSGKTDRGASVNCDMTVSCCCNDYDNEGYMGDLLEHNLQEIFDGTIAIERRKKLDEGILPLRRCFNCRHLRKDDKDKALYYRGNYVLPYSLWIENTIECELSCIGCKKYKSPNMRKKRQLSLEDVSRLSLLIKKNKIKRVGYTKLGDPFFYAAIYDQLKIIKNDNPDLTIGISTHGMSLDSDRKKAAALMADYITFSVDGPNDEILHKYQKGGSFSKSYANMKQLVDTRDAAGLKKPLIQWKYVLFNWNDKEEMILKAIDLARQAGVDSIRFVPTDWPWLGISWRYYLGTFFDKIGSESEGGKIVKFRC